VIVGDRQFAVATQFVTAQAIEQAHNERHKETTEQTEITEQTEKKRKNFPSIPLFPFVPYSLFCHLSSYHNSTFRGSQF